MKKMKDTQGQYLIYIPLWLRLNVSDSEKFAQGIVGIAATKTF